MSHPTTAPALPPTVNPVGASWFEDLSTELLDQWLGLGIGVLGCTANDTWDDTLETMENLQSVKRIVEAHPQAFILRCAADIQPGMVGVLLGLQNPKAMSDSINYLEAFHRHGSALPVAGVPRQQLLGLRLLRAHGLRPQPDRHACRAHPEPTRRRDRPLPFGATAPRWTRSRCRSIR